MNSVATMFATQPVCNVARAAHALRSDQYKNTQLLTTETISIQTLEHNFPLCCVTDKIIPAYPNSRKRRSSTVYYVNKIALREPVKLVNAELKLYFVWVDSRLRCPKN